MGFEKNLTSGIQTSKNERLKQIDFADSIQIIFLKVVDMSKLTEICIIKATFELIMAFERLGNIQ